ncbi:MAG: YdcF family protein [Sneathiellaceae bacterium]
MTRRPVFRQPATGASRLWLLPALLLLALVALWSGAFLQFLSGLPAAASDDLRRTDAVVVLTGGPARLTEGLNLLQRGLAGRLLVSGVNPDVDKAALGEVAGRAELLDCCVDLGFAARNTEENAGEIADWARSRGYDSLRVVTAAYHMPRSLLELRRAAPDIAYTAHPVFPEQIRLQDWWRWRGTAELLVGEFHKYVAALLRARAENALKAARPPRDGDDWPAARPPPAPSDEPGRSQSRALPARIGQRAGQQARQRSRRADPAARP